MNTGYFITFEGGEGTGKSTQSRLLVDKLKKMGKDCILTREPGGSIGAEQIRELLVKGKSSRWDGITETLLFMAARRNHLTQTIWPAMQEGKVVICDRFLDSTIAYQGYGYGKKQDTIDNIQSVYRLIAGNFQPNLTFVLDIDPVIGLKRSCERCGNDEKRFESMDILFHQNLRQGFLELSKNNNRYVVLDATKTVDEIHQKIMKVIQERVR